MPNSILRRLALNVRLLLPWKINNLRFIFGAPLAYRLGHFYSPVCQPEELASLYHDPDHTLLPDSIPGIEAVILHAFLRELKPKRLVEIGSGFSSASALDTIEAHLGSGVACTFIDPYPQRLDALLTPDDKRRLTILRQPVQKVDLAVFDALGENDILFIDTSHVLKTASDVVFELFEILPRLKPGTYVHFHDIHYPFEYPRRWVKELNYSWNEVYALRAFLQYNTASEIVFFNDYFRRKCSSYIAEAAPQLINTLGSGLWLRRV